MRSDEAGTTGGRAGGPPIFNAPSVVIYLISGLILIHLLLQVAPERPAALVEFVAALSPRRFLRGLETGRIFFPSLMPLVTHVFVHASWTHVLMNSAWLLVFGAPVAGRLGCGPRVFDRSALVFTALFLASGVAGGLAFVALHPGAATLLVGASGGVSGLLGGLIRFAFHRPSMLDAGRRRFAPLTDRRVIAWTLVILALNLFFAFFGGLVVPGQGAIAWEAHMGGYLFGLLAFPLFASAARR